MKKPLDNINVLVTREQRQAQPLVKLIEENGGTTIETPLIKVECFANNNESISVDKYDWVFFTSANGVHSFMMLPGSSQLLSRCHIAAVGTKTAKVVEHYAYTVDFIPDTFNAETLAQQFVQLFPQADHLLIVRGNLSRMVLPTIFAKKGIVFDLITMYETKPNEMLKASLPRIIEQKKPHILTFTSPSTVDVFADFLCDVEQFSLIRQLPTVCIGPTTEQQAKKFGFTQIYTPNEFTVEAMVEVLKEIVVKQTYYK